MSNKREFKVISETIKYQNQWMKVVELATITDGNEGIYGVVERSDSATIIVESPEKKILFVRQYRFPTKSYSWELPMGGLNKNELPIVGALRELEEETGYGIELKKIGEFKPVPGLTPQTAFVYYGEISDSDAKKINEFNQNTDEITDRRFFSKDEIKQMISSHEISDGFTLCSLAIMYLN